MTLSTVHRSQRALPQELKDRQASECADLVEILFNKLSFVIKHCLARNEIKYQYTKLRTRITYPKLELSDSILFQVMLPIVVKLAVPALRLDRTGGGLTISLVQPITAARLDPAALLLHFVLAKLSYPNQFLNFIHSLIHPSSTPRVLLLSGSTVGQCISTRCYHPSP